VSAPCAVPLDWVVKLVCDAGNQRTEYVMRQLSPIASVPVTSCVVVLPSKAPFSVSVGQALAKAGALATAYWP
jgi:hypothetical protein